VGARWREEQYGSREAGIVQTGLIWLLCVSVWKRLVDCKLKEKRG